MARFGSSIINAVGKQTLMSFEMIYADIDGGIWITNAPRNISYGGQTYLALGHFLGFSNIDEQDKLTISDVTVTFSGIPAFDDGGRSFLSMVLEHDYIDKRVRIYRAFFDRETFIDAFLMFEGRISSPVIKDNPGQSTTVAITVSNNWVDYDKTNGMLTNDARHQVLYPGDIFFEHASENTKDIVWKKP